MLFHPLKKIPANPETGANDYFTSRHRYDKPYATSILRFLRYPNEESTGRSEDVVASEHTDYGTITLLSQRDIAGLQVDIDGTWTEIPIVHDAILGKKEINIIKVFFFSVIIVFYHELR